MSENTGSSLSDHVTVVLPVFNNAETLVSLSQQLSEILSRRVGPFDLLFVNDASPDGSREILRRLSEDAPYISFIDICRNVGQQQAILEGLKKTKGAFVIVMDADLQDPPSATEKLLEHLRLHDCDAVFATRVGHYQSLPRMVTSWIFKSILSMITNLPHRAGCFVILTREMVSKIIAAPTRNFYLLTAIAHSGLSTRGIPIRRHVRRHGRSAYTALDRIRLGARYFLSLVR